MVRKEKINYINVYGLKKDIKNLQKSLNNSSISFSIDKWKIREKNNIKKIETKFELFLMLKKKDYYITSNYIQPKEIKEYLTNEIYNKFKRLAKKYKLKYDVSKDGSIIYLYN